MALHGAAHAHPGVGLPPGGDRPVPPPRYHLRLRPPSLRERRVVRQSRRLGGTPGRGLLYPHGVGANRWSTVAVRGHNGHHPIPLGEAIWAFPAGLDYYDVFQEGSLDSETWSEFTPVAVSDDPRVAQVEVTAVWVGDEERDAPAAALAERGVTAWLSPAGDGVWSGPSLSIRFYSPGAASRSSILLLSCRGYDTDGELVAFCD